MQTQETNNKLQTYARRLRRDMTDVERFVWYHLRARRFQGYKFRRQVTMGKYIVDFACYEARLIIELDGEQHVEQHAYDAERTSYLETQGYQVLRFWNHVVFEDWETVEEVIWRALSFEVGGDAAGRPLTPSPSPSGGEGSQTGERGMVASRPLTPSPSPSGGEGSQTGERGVVASRPLTPSPSPSRGEGSQTPKKLPLTLWHERHASPHLPMSRAEMQARGWDAVDIVFVTGDAYIDHPSFAMAILGRTLEAAGFRVAILSQPDWRSVDAWRQFGKPRLFFGVSAGNMDSMINHYTANKKVRNDDAYSPGGRIGLRPDRATLPYSQRCREAFPGVPVIAGGVEASLRRLAHYDYWSDTVKRAIMLDAKCDMVAYGMGEKTIVELAKRMQAGATIQQLRGMRGMAFALGAKEKLEDLPPLDEPTPTEGAGAAGRPAPERPSPVSNRDVLPLPSYEEVKADKLIFAETTRLIHLNNSPFNARTLVQYHDNQAVVINPPAFPLSEAEMDSLYDYPYTRRPHPSYQEPIPAQEMIKDSVTIMRGCFGGCTFCSITAHQGRVVQSRSKNSVLKELNKMASDPDFKGTVSDIGGPTANMYQMRCTKPEVEAKCKRLSCVHPSICKLLGTDHGPLVELMKESRDIPGIKKVLVASGVRMDLAQLSPSYMKELAGHHVGGLLKVAPEHVDPDVLAVQKKPDINNFDTFASDFKKASEKGGKPKQYLVPYFISAHPGSDLKAMINLALYLKHNGYKPDQVQDFIPAPFDIATCMYYTGIDPFTKQPVHVAKDLKNRKMQRALMQFFKPENYFEVRKALIEAGRADLIGGCDGLIGANPPKEAMDDRRRRANETASGEYYHKVKNVEGGRGSRRASGEPKRGYRPGRSSQVRQQKPGRG